MTVRCDTSPAATQSRRCAVDVAAGLWRTAQAIKLYGAEHPATRRSALEAAAALAAVQDDAKTIDIRVTPTAVKIAGENLADDATATDLARLFSSLRIAVVKLTRQTTADDALAFLGAVLAKQAGGRWTASDSATLRPIASDRISVVPVDYTSLRAGGLASRIGDVQWEMLVAAVRSDSSVDDVALELNCRLAGAAGLEDASAARAALASVAREALGTSRQRTITRISAIIERLKPDARSRLLAVDSADAPEALHDLVELVEAVDCNDLLATLEAIADPATLVCSESVRLIGSIARVSRGDGVLTDNLIRVMRHAGADDPSDSSGQNGGAKDILRAIKGLLERSRSTAINPEDYDRLLGKLGAGTIREPNPELAARIRTDWTDPRLHSTLLVADLAASPDTSAHDAAGLFRFLDSSFECLADSGDVESLTSAARAGDRLLSGAHTPAAIAPIKAFLLSLQTPERLARVLNAAAPGSPKATHAIDLIRILGTDALTTALRTSNGSGLPRQDVAALLQHPAIDSQAAIAALARLDLPAARSLLRARMLPQAHQSSLATILLASTDEDVRAEAVNALYQNAQSWDSQQVEQALDHPADQCRLQGIDRARGLEPADRLRLLVPLVERAVHEPVAVQVIAAATTVVCTTGAEGVRRLVTICGRLLRVPTPRHWQTLQAIFDTITAHERSGGTGASPTVLLCRVLWSAFKPFGRTRS